MLIKKLIVLTLGVFLGAQIAVAAGDPPPLAMLKKTADKMVVKLDKHQSQLKTNDKLVYDIVDSTLVPVFAVKIMSRSVVGRAAWKASTPDVQNQFINEFKKYIIRTYSGAIASYDGERIKFSPMRNFSSTDKRVKIYSDLLQKGGPSIPISYRLLKLSGKWWVYDFSVEGVSLVQNYRGQFAAPLRKGGLTYLVADLKKHNKSLNN